MLNWPMVHDAPILNYVGWSLLNGAIPYRDLFDMNFPGTYAFHVFLATLPGDWDFKTALFNVVIVVASASAIALIVRQICGHARASIAAACTYIVICYGFSSWYALQRDALMVPFLCAGLAALLSAAPEQRRWFVAGIFFGLASAIKPQCVFFASAALAALVLHDLSAERGLRPSVKAGFSLVCGGIIAWIPFVIWLGAVGALSDFARILLNFILPVYPRLDHALAATGRADTSSVLTFVLPDLLGLDLGRTVRLGAILVSLHYVFFRRNDFRRLAVALTFLAAIACFYAQLKGWAYHLYPAFAFALIILGVAAPEILNAPRRALAPMILQSATVFLIGGLLWQSFTWLDPNPRQNDVKVNRTKEIVTFLADKIAAGKTVQIFDTAEGGADVMLRLGARLPSPMLYDFPLYIPVLLPEIKPDYLKGLQSELVTSVMRAAPNFLLIFEIGWPLGRYERINNIPLLPDWIKNHYLLVSYHKGYRIYERQESAQ